MILYVCCILILSLHLFLKTQNLCYNQVSAGVNFRWPYILNMKGYMLLQQETYDFKDIVFLVICFNEGHPKYDLEYIMLFLCSI